MIITEKQYIDVPGDTASALWFASRCSTRLWNQCHEHREAALAANEPCGYLVQKRLIPQWKREDERLKQPSSQQVQEVVKEYHGALKSFFEKRKNGDTDCRPPGFRSSRYFFSQHFPQRYNSFEISDDGCLQLAFGRKRADWLRLALKPGEYQDVKTVRLCYDDVLKRFFVCLHREVAEVEAKKEGLSLYFDPGCKTTLTGISSEGELFEYDINPLRQINMSTFKLLEQLMSERDTKTKGSYRWRRLNKRIAKLWRKMKGRTKAYLHTLANQIFADHPTLKELLVGDWKKQETLADTGYTFVNKRINRAVQNNNPVKTLVEILSYKGRLRHGVSVDNFDERGTTRTCSRCDYVHPEGVSPTVRQFSCPACDFHYPRDWQSGLNFLKRFQPAVWNGLVGDEPTSSVRTTLAPFALKAQRSSACYTSVAQAS